MRSSSLTATVLVAAALWLSCAVQSAAAADMYCGEKNCYELLNVDSGASAADIKKAFYRVSLTLHPDKNKAVDAEARYRDVVNAYEVLSDAVSRANYDDARAHPERFFTNTYQYYQYRAGMHHTALWKVVVGLLSFLTVCHYLYWVHRYRALHDVVKGMPAVQKRMRQAVLAKHPDVRDDGSAESDKRIDALIGAENIRDYVSISGWESLPGWRDLLCVQLVTRYPAAVASLVWWHVRWFWKFTVRGDAYGHAEREYITAQALRIHWDRWAQMPDAERKSLTDKELWKPANMREFRREIISGRKKKW